MRRPAALAIVLALCGSLSACGSSSSSLTSAPTGVGAPIVAAALAQKSVHFTYFHQEDMGWPTQWTSDVSADSGTQRITFVSARIRGKAQLRLVDHTVYVKGDVGGLMPTLHLPDVTVKRYAGQWISIPEGDPLYAELADGLTLASLLEFVTPNTKFGWKLRLVRKPHSLELLQVDTGTNGVPGEVLTARASGEPLPIAFNDERCMGCSIEGHFSKWHEPLHVEAPTHSIPIATVRGA